jgi:hypothetical protein
MLPPGRGAIANGCLRENHIPLFAMAPIGYRAGGGMQSDAPPHLTGPANLFNPSAAPARAAPFRRSSHVDR